MKLRKALCAFLGAVMLLSLVACGGQQQDPDISEPESADSSDVSAEPSAPADSDVTSDQSSDVDSDVVSRPGSTTTTTKGNTSFTTKAVINEEDNKVYPNFGGAKIVFATYGKKPTLNGDALNDAKVNAMSWAEKKYNCTVEYKVYDSSKMDEAFTAASLAGSFFADAVTANCIGFVGWCQSKMLETTDKYFANRKDMERWAFEAGRFRDQHFGIDAVNSSVQWPSFLLVNNNLLKDYGLENPQALAKAGKWDFDTFRSYCKKVTNKSKGTYGMACFGFAEVLEIGAGFQALVPGKKDGKTWYYNGYSYKEGKDANGLTMYDKALSTLNMMQQMRNVDKSVFGDSTGGLQPVLDAEEAFAKGKILFLDSGFARALTVRKAGNKNFSVVTYPTMKTDTVLKENQVRSYTFTGFPKRTTKSLAKASSKNVSMDDLAAFWMDANTTWNKSRGKAFYDEQFEEIIAETAANYLCNANDARFLYDMGKDMKSVYEYSASLETGNTVIDGLHMPVLLGQKSPASAIKEKDAEIQAYADNTWNKG